MSTWQDRLCAAQAAFVAASRFAPAPATATTSDCRESTRPMGSSRGGVLGRLLVSPSLDEVVLRHKLVAKAKEPACCALQSSHARPVQMLSLGGSARRPRGACDSP